MRGIRLAHISLAGEGCHRSGLRTFASRRSNPPGLSSLRCFFQGSQDRRGWPGKGGGRCPTSVIIGLGRFGFGHMSSAGSFLCRYPKHWSYPSPRPPEATIHATHGARSRRSWLRSPRSTLCSVRIERPCRTRLRAFPASAARGRPGRSQRRLRRRGARARRRRPAPTVIERLRRRETRWLPPPRRAAAPLGCAGFRSAPCWPERARTASS